MSTLASGRSVPLERIAALATAGQVLAFCLALVACVATGLSPAAIAAVLLGSLLVERAIPVRGITPVLAGVDAADAERELPAVHDAVCDLSDALGIDPPRTLVDTTGAGLFVAAVDDGALVVSRSTLDRLDRDHVRALLAHELAHLTFDRRRADLREVLATFVGFSGLWIGALRWQSPLVAVAAAGAYVVLGAVRRSRFADLLFVAGSLGLVLVPIALFRLEVRLEEYRADDLAVELTSSEAFCAGLVRVHDLPAAADDAPAGSLVEPRRDGRDEGILERALAMHPPLERRLGRHGHEIADFD